LALGALNSCSVEEVDLATLLASSNFYEGILAQAEYEKRIMEKVKIK